MGRPKSRSQLAAHLLSQEDRRRWNVDVLQMEYTRKEKEQSNPWQKEFATRRFATNSGACSSCDISKDCRSGEVLSGLIKPTECEAFGTRCTPDSPLGAPMVSSEGACAAYYKYQPTVGMS